jgi:transposase
MNAAIVYSLLATCKIRNIEPFAWLKNMLEIIPDYTASQLEDIITA